MDAKHRTTPPQLHTATLSLVMPVFDIPTRFTLSVDYTQTGGDIQLRRVFFSDGKRRAAAPITNMLSKTVKEEITRRLTEDTNASTNSYHGPFNSDMGLQPSS